MDGLSYEPLKFYKDFAKDKHKEYTEERFEELVRKSGIDAEKNRATVAKHEEELAKLKKIASKIKLLKVLFWMTLIIGILGALCLLLGVLMTGESSEYALPFTIFGGIGGVLGFVLSLAVIRPKIENCEKLRDEYRKNADMLYSEALSQMQPLNALFDDCDTLRLVEKILPDVKFERTYRNDTERLLIEDYDYVDMTDDNTSVIEALSGTLFENPFLFERYVSHEMGNQIYNGSLVISWTERRKTSKGWTTERRSQVLTASVTKPKPFYFTKTHLGFGSQAAPDLSFSRGESDTDELSEKALQRRIKKGEKALHDKAKKAVTKGGDFREMANSEFDVLFGAIDRDHEVQFRVLFTPLAQTNTVDLLRSKDGYGDDFDFIKRGRFNIIKSNHSQIWDMNLSSDKYRSHSVDVSKKRFVDFNTNYFKSVFFDFAPIMSIPAYRAAPVPSMKDPKEYIGCYTQYEHEALANAIGDTVFAHENAATPSILKTTMIEKRDGVDRLAVTAFAFAQEPRVDYIPVLGGDGRIHPVPVPWVEYIPVCKSSEMLVKSLGLTEREFREKNAEAPQRSAYLHGLLAYSPIAAEAWSKVEETFKKYI